MRRRAAVFAWCTVSILAVVAVAGDTDREAVVRAARKIDRKLTLCPDCKGRDPECKVCLGGGKVPKWRAKAATAHKGDAAGFAVLVGDWMRACAKCKFGLRGADCRVYYGALHALVDDLTPLARRTLLSPGAEFKLVAFKAEVWSLHEGSFDGEDIRYAQVAIKGNDWRQKTVTCFASIPDGATWLTDSTVFVVGLIAAPLDYETLLGGRTAYFVVSMPTR